MNAKSLLVVLTISIISVASHCANMETEKALNTYKISGKITMINRCTNNQADLPDKVLVDVDLICTDGTQYNRSRRDIPTNPVAGANNQKEAMYDFTVRTNLTADKWKFNKIKRDSGTEICNLISCPGGQHCRDTSSNVRTVAANDGDANPTEVTKDFTFDCRCQ